MPRDYKVYLEDLLEAAGKIRRYTEGLSLHSFRNDSKTFDAVVRNLEIIGEAAKNLPKEVREKHGQVEWKRIAALRNILTHEYFGVDPEIIWDIVRHKLTDLEDVSRKILNL